MRIAAKLFSCIVEAVDALGNTVSKTVCEQYITLPVIFSRLVAAIFFYQGRFTGFALLPAFLWTLYCLSLPLCRCNAPGYRRRTYATVRCMM